jgi:HEPN domain-containing protein
MKTAMDCAVVRNSFARECFRNVADEDYISARTAYRMGLMNHFLWSGQQALEKYLKSILLINGQSTLGIGHKLDVAYDRCKVIPAIGFSLPREELFLLRHLSHYGANRYLEIPSYTMGNELPLLDSVVWMTRRYCQPLKHKLRLRDGSIKEMLALNLGRIRSSEYERHPHRFKLIGGFLEKILESKVTDKRRQALVWGNRHYGPGKTLRLRRSHSVNPPQFRYPQELPCLEGLVYLPQPRVQQPKRGMRQDKRTLPPPS